MKVSKQALLMALSELLDEAPCLAVVEGNELKIDWAPHIELVTAYLGQHPEDAKEVFEIIIKTGESVGRRLEIPPAQGIPILMELAERLETQAHGGN